MGWIWVFISLFDKAAFPEIVFSPYFLCTCFFSAYQCSPAPVSPVWGTLSCVCRLLCANLLAVTIFVYQWVIADFLQLFYASIGFQV